MDPALTGLPWEETPCSTCKLSDDPSHKGKSHVSRDWSEAVEAEEAMQPQEMALMDSRIEKLAGFIDQFMSLPAITRDIVAFRFSQPDKPLNVVASRHKITVQAVHSRLKKALKRFPVLGEVIQMRTTGGNKNDD